MRIEAFPDDAWAAAVAARWIRRLHAQPDLVMCLPTGATPRPVYSMMAAAVIAGTVSFAGAQVYLLDEFGGLAPDDAGRCDAMIDRHLVGRIDLPPGSLHKLDPDAVDIDAEAARYGAALRQAGLDLTLVGIGVNGHIGLNEPGSSAESTARRVELASSTQESMRRYGAGHSAAWGLTLGMAEILQSAEVWLVATGQSKAAIVAAALKGPISSAVPASLLRQHPKASALLDQSAASALGG